MPKTAGSPGTAGSTGTAGHPVVVDLRAVQSPNYRGRGIARWAGELAAALERTHPQLVGAYLLDPEWPPPGALDEVVSSAKVHYGGTAEAAVALARARVFYCVSPFELERNIAHVRPREVDQLGLRYAATAFDLIPFQRVEQYLADPGVRRLYMARLEVVRSADAVLAISDAVAQDVIEQLGVPARRCHAVGSGVSPRFVPPVSRASALAELRETHDGIDGPFVLFPGGSDPRKNTDGLIAAFGALAEESRADLRLVVVGDLPDTVAAHYRHLAHAAGIARSLVLTGYVTDETLRTFYQAASLVVFPSLAEGFGLPVAEALASGAVCCVSDRPPLTELVWDARARFDPTDRDDMAATMARCLSDETVRAQVRADAASSVSSWDAVAHRVAAVLDDLARSSARPRRERSRRRIAVVSPFPPVPGGVSGYSAAMVEAMRRAADPPIEIDCFVDGRNRYPVRPEPVGATVPVDAALFERIDGAIGGYDRVLYVLGNSECHSNALGALRRRSGTVLSHDVRLSGLLSFSSHTRGAAPGGMEAAIARAYPGLPEGLGRHGSLDPVEAERYGLYLLKDVLADAERLFVCSEAARRLAVLDAGPDLSARIGVVPFAVSRLAAPERERVEAARAARAARSRGPLVISSFGIVDPQKRPEVLVGCVAELVGRGIDVVAEIVGAASDAMRDALRAQARASGLSERVRIRGDVQWTEYLEILGSTDIAVQLRHRFSGECSGTVSECLSAGVPTVVARTGWMADIPDTAACKVDPACRPGDVADVVEALAKTSSRRAALGAAGRSWADSQTFDHVARALLEAMQL